LEEKIENIEKMKKNMDKLLEENEKLRVNVRNLKKASFGNSFMGISKNTSDLYNKSILSSKEYFQE